MDWVDICICIVIAITALLYGATAALLFYKGNQALGSVYVFYALSNIGLCIVALEKI